MKFVHAADIHLGAQPDKGCPWSLKRQKEIWDTFRRLIDRVRTERAELLLIAGDLFHRQPLKSELMEVNYLFSTIPDTQVVLMAGNHDYMKSDSYYREFRWNENVTFFASRKPSRVYLKSIDTYVYGLSYESREITDAVYDSFLPGREKGTHILLAHGGDEKHIPVSFSALGNLGYDYVALGHIHKPRMMEEKRMAYAGALEPVDKNDLGEHGFVLGTIVHGKTRISFVPFAKRNYFALEFQTDETMAQSAVEARIVKQIQEYGQENQYSITLVGSREKDMSFDAERIYRLGRIVEVEDFTEPYWDLEALRRRYKGTIVEEFIEQFGPSPDGIDLKALHYGIRALLK